MTGNFIGDHVIGKNYIGYSEGMIKGIELHRAIDAFTDSHPVVIESKLRLRPGFHKYSPVIADVFYDHFLAASWNTYSIISLYDYTQIAYSELNLRTSILPPKAKHMLSYMIPQNWLLNYSRVEGIHKALTGMSRRTRFDSGMEKASVWLEKDYEKYKNEFDLFFPSLIIYCKNMLGESFIEAAG